ncbi:MAG: lysylphosphatidylglycerol synthase transmembrane domain-containing protein [Solirubrobacteraceae bacterium]
MRSSWGSRTTRGVLIAIAATALVAILAFALSRLGLHRIAHALLTASPGWVALALALMALSLLLRSISWQQVLRAALPDTKLPWPTIVRALMIGVMGSALFPGRIGEPTRVLVLGRRLEGSTKRLLPVIAGTVFSQTLINLGALAILAAITLTNVPLLHGRAGAILAALIVPLAICLVVLAGPRLLALARHSRSQRLARAAQTLSQALGLARLGLAVFARPRHAVAAVAAQLAAWALQWLSCYTILLALGLGNQTDLVTAAAILLAVNLSAILPATPSNVGVFQAACLVVLAAYGVGGGPSLAYGIILQAVEVLTALALGIPALLGEGMNWSDLRSRAREASDTDPDEPSDGL